MTSKTSDENIGRLLSRRETLRLIGAAGAAALVGGGDGRAMALWPTARHAAAVENNVLPGALRQALFSAAPRRVIQSVSELTCVARPAQTEGPYFVDERLNRSDIRTDPATGAVKAGVPLRLTINVSHVTNGACSPLAGALVDVWHCDALGSYSDVSGAGQSNTTGQKFLRGYQVTDANGSVTFTTIYPGWYTGRTVHIHFKIRLFAGATRTYDFTSQLYFSDALSDQVFTQAPYNTRGQRNTRNANDGIHNSGGSQLTLTPTSDGQGGYAASFDIGLAGLPATVAVATPVSAASYAPGLLAGEMIAALFGAGLAGGEAPATSLPLPTTLGGARVLVRDANGTEREAPLYYVSPGQINFQVPPGTVAGGALINVLRDGAAVGQGSTTVGAVAPGFFAAGSGGSGYAVGRVVRLKADGTRVGEEIVRYNAGANSFEGVAIDFGAADDQLYLETYGTGWRAGAATAVARIAGASVPVTYAGAQGTYVGLDQLNLQLPRGLQGMGETELELEAGGVKSNRVKLSFR